MSSTSSPATHSATTNTIFSIEGNGLKFDTVESIEPYLNQLNQVEDLQEIRLGGNTLGIQACASVGSALVSKSNLSIADFSDIFTGRLISEIPLALKSLCTSLLYLSNLTSLDLSDNAFGGRSVEPMLELLSTHSNLKILKLNNNGMGPFGGADIAGALLANALKAKAEGRKPTLQTLICGRNRLENGSSAAFAAAFSALGTLREVRMPQNGIRMEGIEAIVKALRSNVDLEVLDLQDNTATERGSRAISKSLPYWPKLTSLNLSDCLLRPKGGITIMNTLLSNSNPLLKSLKLQSNELDSRAIKILASAIKINLNQLVELELNGNRGEAEDECYVLIGEALAVWGHEEALDELDELEEDEDDDEDEEEQIESEEEELEAKEEKVLITGQAETGGEDVRGNEAEVVKADKTAENDEEPKVKGDDKESDELASLLGKVSL